MKFHQFFYQSVQDLLKGVIYKSIQYLIELLKDVLRIVKVICSHHRLPHADTNATNTHCGTIHHTSFHRPDPLIYSQQYLLKLGLAVTWDNPDIVLLKNGVIVSEGDLLPNTDYEIDAAIWNNSYDAPVVGLTVDFSYLSFGAGTTSQPIGTKIINLGVKGGINHPAHARIMWRTPPAGHYCIQVNLKWVDDLNPENNMGQNNVNVVAPQSPAKFSFMLKNNTGKRRTYTFRTDTYTLPEAKDCPEKITVFRNNDMKWKEIQSVHNINNYPVPANWTVVTAPAEISLMPDEEAEIEVNITPPDNFTGKKAFNVHSLYEEDKYAGGITVYVLKP